MAVLGRTQRSFGVTVEEGLEPCLPGDLQGCCGGVAGSPGLQWPWFFFFEVTVPRLTGFFEYSFALLFGVTAQWEDVERCN